MGPSVNEIQNANSLSPSYLGNAAARPYENQPQGYYASHNNNHVARNLGPALVANPVSRPLRERSRSRSPTERILDIQTDESQYTEVFSWGADYHG